MNTHDISGCDRAGEGGNVAGRSSGGSPRWTAEWAFLPLNHSNRQQGLIHVLTRPASSDHGLSQPEIPMLSSVAAIKSNMKINFKYTLEN